MESSGFRAMFYWGMPKKSHTTRTRRKQPAQNEVPTAPATQTLPVHRTTTVHAVMQHRRSGETALTPCIRILGKWLAAANFNKGDKLTIEVGDGQLTLKRQEVAQ